MEGKLPLNYPDTHLIRFTDLENEPAHNKTNKMTSAPSEDSDQTRPMSLHWAHRSFCCFYHAAVQITTL